MRISTGSLTSGLSFSYDDNPISAADHMDTVLRVSRYYRQILAI